MRTIDTGGITYIAPVPEGTAEWYYGLSSGNGDLYEAEEVFRAGHAVKGNRLCLIHYPDGQVFLPFREEEGTYFESPVFLDGQIYILKVDFVNAKIFIYRFGCSSHCADILAEIPLSAVRNCYNLKLHTAPLCLTRQGDEGLFEIVYPEKAGFEMDPHESFFLREGGKLYFNKWYEEGEGPEYRYFEETVVRDLDGNVIETLSGDIRVMPDGEWWHFV